MPLPMLIPDLTTLSIEYGLSPYELLDSPTKFDRKDEATLRSNDLWLKFLKQYFSGETEVIKNMEAFVLESNLVKSGAKTSKAAEDTSDGVVKKEFVRLAQKLGKALQAGKPLSLVGAEHHIMDDYFIRRVFKLNSPEEVRVKLQELCELNELIPNSITDVNRLKFCLSLYPEAKQLEKAQQKRKWDHKMDQFVTARDKLLLHRALTNPESLKILFNLYPKAELMAALKEEDRAGNTLLRRAAENVKLLKAVLDLIPREELMAVMGAKDSAGNTLLHSAAWNHESFNFVLSLYPLDKRIAAIEQRNRSQQTVLHRAAINSESLQAALNQYPKVKRREALEQRDIIGRTVLNLSCYSPEAINLILSHYPVDERWAAVIDTNNNGQALFHAAACFAPKSLPAIINLLPEHHQIEMLKKIVDNTSLAEIFTKNKLTFDNPFAEDYLFIEHMLNQNDTSQRRGFFASSTKSASMICVDWDKAQSFDEIKKMVINFLSHPENSKSMIVRILLDRLVKGEDKHVEALAKQWSIPIETLSQKPSYSG